MREGNERHWRERYPSGDTTYQSVPYRTLSRAAEKVYDDGLQSDVLIDGVLRYDVWHISRFCLGPRTCGVPPSHRIRPEDVARQVVGDSIRRFRSVRDGKHFSQVNFEHRYSSTRVDK
jgi:hypothetical protein